MLTRRNSIGILGASFLGACVGSPRLRHTASINRSEYVPIGGIEQFISIRGDNESNPVMVIIHGGPGNAMSPFQSVFAPWEKDFTVVNWDQRGSGKTFGRDPQKINTLTPESIVDDAIEVIEYACRELKTNKVIICCHSYGAFWGWRVVQRRPDLLRAFVGSGMMVNYRCSLDSQEADAQEKAKNAGDLDALKAMQEARNLPMNDIRRPRPIRKWLVNPDDAKYLMTQDAFIRLAPDNADARSWVEGQRQTTKIKSILDVMLNYDIAKEGLSSTVPIMFIHGNSDNISPPSCLREVYGRLRAPYKSLNFIDGGHFSCFTNPLQFVEKIRNSPIYT